jgi:hypothetical protein
MLIASCHLIFDQMPVWEDSFINVITVKIEIKAISAIIYNFLFSNLNNE